MGAEAGWSSNGVEHDHPDAAGVDAPEVPLYRAPGDSEGSLAILTRQSSRGSVVSTVGHPVFRARNAAGGLALEVHALVRRSVVTEQLVLYGRETERARLDALLEGARSSLSGVLVVRGEAGIGKSALLDQAIGRADGTPVLRATGVESEAELAFAGLHQLLRPVLGMTERLPAGP